MSILVEDVSKRFGDYQALEHVFLEIEEGSLVALVGPSGSGKSTLLRVLAGLESPDWGRVWMHGRDCTGVRPQSRDVGFVFQSYALFQHLTVYENIAFGLKIRHKKRTFVNNRVKRLLQLVQLEGVGDRFPNQLSGGQQQRVALARALAVEPKILLLDEPFGALDFKVRKGLRGWLRTLHQEAPTTTVFVTHDHQEALEIAHEIVVLDKGQVKRIGEPADFAFHLAKGKDISSSLL